MRALIAFLILVGVVAMLWFDAGQVLAPSVDTAGDRVTEAGTTTDLDADSRDGVEAAPATFSRTEADTVPSVVEAGADPAELDELAVRSVTFVVLSERGDPVEGAEVAVELGWQRSGEIAPFDEELLGTDVDGVALLEIDPTKRKLTAADMDSRVGLRVGARDESGTRVSAFQLLFPPLDPGPHELRLAPASSVVLVVTEDGSAPVEGARIYLDPAGPDSQITRSARSDAAGEARVEGLAPGEWQYYVGAPVGERNVRGTFSLNVGEQGRVDVQLSGDGPALAVSGSFVDEQGAPIGPDFIDRPVVWIGSSLAQGDLVHLDSLGRFAVYRAPSEEVVLVTDVGVSGHRYDPARVTVPFGTTGLEFRRVERLDEGEFFARVVDAETGEPVPGARLLLTGGETQFASNPRTYDLGDGLHSFPYRARPGLRWVVSAPGYAWRVGAVDGTHHGSADEAMELRMTRGIESHVVVLDARTDAPIVGAMFTDQSGAEVARSDDTGAVILAAPGRLKLVAPGYAPRTWYAAWQRDRAYLDPVPR